MRVVALLCLCFAAFARALVTRQVGCARRLITAATGSNRVQTALYDVPLELTGQLDPSKKWDVKFIFEGKEKVVSVCEDTSFLDMGEKIFDGVDSSCRNGICTTCAGQVVEGRDKVKLAVHGLGQAQIGTSICQCSKSRFSLVFGREQSYLDPIHFTVTHVL